MSSIFWDITPCNPLKLSRRFGNVGRCQLLVSGMTLCPADRGDMFLRNDGLLSTNCTSIYPTRHTLHNNRSENLKSYTEINYVPYNFNSPFWSNSHSNNSYINTNINSNYKVIQTWPGLICVYTSRNKSRSYLNHLVKTFNFSSFDKPHNIQAIQQPAQTSCKISFNWCYDYIKSTFPDQKSIYGLVRILWNHGLGLSRQYHVTQASRGLLK
jgi:hypothetical protein